ncbi:MAG: leucine--tRNA ligase [Candidatus Pacebacteria bacterium]|nr:leucine--tRNA ligase [Candidatus Paceibacterota bacterium]
MNYEPQNIEKKWQDYWGKNNLYKTEEGADKPKCYVLDMFPYPSGSGLHVGHFKGYVATDIMARLKRMQGFNVLHPMGWDAFGLPAENYALKTGIHPAITTEKNIVNIKNQMERAGFSYDWGREISSADPAYYKWTQWIFLKLYEKGLAYKKLLPINWCPSCKTGLANEEVVEGKCERCGTETTKKDIEQWVLKITDYADRLLNDLEGLDWPDKIKEMQKNWIGRSEGWEISFPIKGGTEEIKVFTTRADTLFGCTYAVLAPEHPLLEKLAQKIENESDVLDYIEEAKNKSDRERISEVKEKTGIKIIGLTAINPVNNKEIPIFVADYVLGHYGTGAVMAVPAHDARDFDFAAKYGLPIIRVIKPASGEIEEEKAFVDDGVLFASDGFDGLKSEQAREKIGEHLEKQNKARKTINYKLRDWVFSRQRYWGEPIPIIICEKCGIVPLSEKDLPLELPKVEKYEPTGTGESPLAAIDDWVNVECPKCGGKAKRETNTMPQWAGSCWYYLRFLDNKNDKELVGKDKEKRWMPVDLYVGGAEHAVLHLLYSRFWHKFLFDIGVISTNEPFQKLRNVGLVLAADGQKMSKSKGNVIAPEQVADEFGADTLRIYEMFMGPFDQAIGWNTQGVSGVYRFLNRTWDLAANLYGKEKSSEKVISETNKLVRRAAVDLEKMKFNTCVAFFMEYINFISDNKEHWGRDCVEKFLKIFSPFAPHFCEELWSNIGNNQSITLEKWPAVDEKSILEEKIVMAIQINGKMRGKIEIPADLDKGEVEDIAFNDSKIAPWIQGKEIKDIVFVPNKIINIVIK